MNGIATAGSSTTCIREPLAAAGLVVERHIAGWVARRNLRDRDHPFMLGTQFHPELQSRPNRPHPLFRDLVLASIGRLEKPEPNDAAVAAAVIASGG